MDTFNTSANVTNYHSSANSKYDVHTATVVLLVIPIIVVMSLVAMHFQRRLTASHSPSPSLMALFRESMDKKRHDSDGAAPLANSNLMLMNGMKTHSSLSTSTNQKGSTRYHKHNNFHQPHPSEMDEAMSPEKGFSDTIDIEDLQWDREPPRPNQAVTTLSSSFSILHKSMSSISSTTTFQAWLTHSTSMSVLLASDGSSARTTAPSTTDTVECDTPTFEASEMHDKEASKGVLPQPWRLSWPAFTSVSKPSRTATSEFQDSVEGVQPPYAITLIPMASHPSVANEDFVTVYDNSLAAGKQPLICDPPRRPRNHTKTTSTTTSYMLQL